MRAAALGGTVSYGSSFIFSVEEIDCCAATLICRRHIYVRIVA
jgi:hypothetical protein